jgi:hypothetical protein
MLARKCFVALLPAVPIEESFTVPRPGRAARPSDAHFRAGVEGAQEGPRFGSVLKLCCLGIGARVGREKALCTAKTRRQMSREWSSVGDHSLLLRQRHYRGSVRPLNELDCGLAIRLVKVAFARIGDFASVGGFEIPTPLPSGVFVEIECHTCLLLPCYG